MSWEQVKYLEEKIKDIGLSIGDGSNADTIYLINELQGGKSINPFLIKRTIINPVNANYFFTDELKKLLLDAADSNHLFGEVFNFLFPDFQIDENDLTSKMAFSTVSKCKYILKNLGLSFSNYMNFGNVIKSSGVELKILRSPTARGSIEVNPETVPGIITYVTAEIYVAAYSMAYGYLEIDGSIFRDAGYTDGSVNAGARYTNQSTKLTKFLNKNTTKIKYYRNPDCTMNLNCYYIDYSDTPELLPT